MSKETTKDKDIVSGKTFDEKEEELKKDPMAKVSIETSDKPEETISVSKSLLETIQEELREKGKKIDMLEEVADKKRLSQFYQRNQQAIPKIIKLKTIGNKVITGWTEMTQNDVSKDPSTMRWREVQEVNLIFEDGTSLKMPYLEYTRQYKYIEAEVISRSVNEATGDTMLKVVRLDTQKEYEINILYIN